MNIRKTKEDKFQDELEKESKEEEETSEEESGSSC